MTLAETSGHRLYPLYVVAATMGPRRGELLGIRWKDVDLDNGTLSIEKTVQRAGGHLRLQDTKTEGSEAVLPLPEWTSLALLQHREAQEMERTRLGEIWQEHVWRSHPNSARRWSPATATATSLGYG